MNNPTPARLTDRNRREIRYILPPLAAAALKIIDILQETPHDDENPGEVENLGRAIIALQNAIAQLEELTK